jgi:hypothetical protein
MSDLARSGIHIFNGNHEVTPSASKTSCTQGKPYDLLQTPLKQCTEIPHQIPHLKADNVRGTDFE